MKLEKKNTFRSCFSFTIVSIFICVGTTAITFLTKLLYFTTKQTVSPLLLFHVNGASERHVIPVTERHQAIARGHPPYNTGLFQ